MKLLVLHFIILITVNEGFSQNPKKAELVSLNGTNVYYEVYGKGEPLFLSHGYFSSSKSWKNFVSDYADNFEVYLIDLKGHGKSSPFTEKLSIRSMAKDLDALIKHLKLKSLKAIGFSYGGDALFQLSLLSSGIIKSMIVIGACGRWDVNDFPYFLAKYNSKNLDSLQWIREYHTNEIQIKAILDQFANYSVSMSDEEIRSITAKTLFVLGDHDNTIGSESVLKVKNKLPLSYMWIVPNTGHSAHEEKNKNEFIGISREFLMDQWKN